MQANYYEKYRQQSVMTMTPGEMLTRLYDETVLQLSSGAKLIRSRDFAGANRALQKAQAILNHLSATLDDRYEISGQLGALYEFFTYSIVQANLRKETEPIEQILPMIIELREAFVQADRTARTR